jgi:hypothetical protein
MCTSNCFLSLRVWLLPPNRPAGMRLHFTVPQGTDGQALTWIVCVGCEQALSLEPQMLCRHFSECPETSPRWVLRLIPLAGLVPQGYPSCVKSAEVFLLRERHSDCRQRDCMLCHSMLTFGVPNPSQDKFFGKIILRSFGWEPVSSSVY